MSAHNVDILQGMIKADKIESAANSVMTVSQASASPDRMEFLHLSVWGKAI